MTALVVAAMAVSNVMYVVGAVVAATLLSGIVMFRHRRPRSLESGIEMFSRELKALQPDPRGALPGGRPAAARGGAGDRGTPGNLRAMPGGGGAADTTGRRAGRGSGMPGREGGESPAARPIPGGAPGWAGTWPAEQPTTAFGWIPSEASPARAARRRSRPPAPRGGTGGGGGGGGGGVGRNEARSSSPSRRDQPG